MIIINEYEYVKQILESKVVPKGVSNKRILLYIAKYYFNPLYTVDEMKQFIFQKMNEFNFPLEYYQEYKYISYVEDICRKLLKEDLSPEFRKVESVSIYQSELNIINQGKNDKQRKLLFTLFVLAKINGTNSGWVNNDLKDVFQLANVTATIKDRAAIIYELYHMGLIDQSHKIDNLSLKVELCQNDELPVLVVDSFKNIGNQYIANFKPGWKMCECCGKLFKIKGTNSKYCKICKKTKELEKYMRYNEKR